MSLRPFSKRKRWTLKFPTKGRVCFSCTVSSRFRFSRESNELVVPHAVAPSRAIATTTEQVFIGQSCYTESGTEEYEILTDVDHYCFYVSCCFRDRIWRV